MPDDNVRAFVDAMAQLRSMRSAEPVGERPPIEILDITDMLEPDLHTGGVVKGLIPAQAVALIFGESSVGKTFLTLDLSMHVAMGRDWCGHKIREPQRVVYVATEAAKGIRNRVAALVREMRTSELFLPLFRAVVSPVDLCHLDIGDVDRLIEAVGEADFVVIDTVSRALSGGDENAPRDMGAFIRALDLLRDRLGCTVLAVHHVGKDSSRGSRGHSSLHCAVDTEILVEKDEDTGISTARVTKQRDLPSGQEYAFTLRSVVLGPDQDRENVTSCVVEHLPDYEKPAASKKLGKNAKIALDELCAAIDAKGTIEDGVRSVSADEWRDWVKNAGRFNVTDSAFNVTWRRARDDLTKAEPPWVRIRGERAWPRLEEDGFARSDGG